MRRFPKAVSIVDRRSLGAVFFSVYHTKQVKSLTTCSYLCRGQKELVKRHALHLKSVRMCRRASSLLDLLFSGSAVGASVLPWS
ncbi:hypothetical protein V6N13_098385 [Hibiscus sabdariffa]